MGGPLETVTLRITLRYRDVDEFIERHAAHVSSAGLFIRTKSPKTPGTQVRFELRLADGNPALMGSGAVVSVREDDNPGMALRFSELTPESQAVVDRLVAEHGDGTFAPTPLALKGTGATTDLSTALGAGPAFSSTDSFLDLSSPAWPVADIAATPTTGPLPELRPETEPETQQATGSPPGAEPPAVSASPPEDEVAPAPAETRSGESGEEDAPSEPASTPPATSRAPEPDTLDVPDRPPTDAVDAAPTTPASPEASPGPVPADTPVIGPPAGSPPPASGGRASGQEASDAPADAEAAPDGSAATADLGPAADLASATAEVAAATAEVATATADVGADEEAGAESEVSTVSAPLPALDDGESPAAPRWGAEPDVDIELEEAVSFDALSAPSVETPADAGASDPAAAEAAEREPSVARVAFPPPDVGQTDDIETDASRTDPNLDDPFAVPTVVEAVPPLPESTPAAAAGPADAAAASAARDSSLEPAASSAEPATTPQLASPGPWEDTGPIDRTDPDVGAAVQEALDSGSIRSADLPAGVVRAVGLEWSTREIRAATLERSEMRMLTQGAVFPAWVGVRSDGRLVVGPAARTVADTDPSRVLSPMEVLRAVRDDQLDESRFPITGWGPQGGVVHLGDQRLEFYELLLAIARQLQDTIAQQMEDEDFHVFLGLPPGLEDGPLALLRSAFREAGIAVGQFPKRTDVLLASFNLHERPVDNVVLVSVEDLYGEAVFLRRGNQGLRPVGRRDFSDVAARIVDDTMVSMLTEELQERTNLDHRNHPVTQARLREAVILARNDLRRTPTIELKVGLPQDEGATGVSVEQTLTLARTQVYGATEDVTGRLHDHLIELLRDAGTDPRSIGAVVLAGEGASFPPFQQVIAQLFAREPLMAQPPNHANLIGLCKIGRSAELRVVADRPDTLNSSIGIALPGGRFKVLVPAGTQLPTRLRRSQPLREGQVEFELRLLQGDGELVKSCTPLGGLVLRGLPPRPKGALKVDLDLRVDAQGVLTATIREKESGHAMESVFATAQVDEDVRANLPQPTQPRGAVENAAKQKDRGLLGRLFGKR
jgi:molecular chaperone DnaK